MKAIFVQLRNAIVILAALLSPGCGPRFTPASLEKGVLDGLSKIPAARQMDEVFGKENLDHYISYSGPKAGTTWSSTAFFGGRYKLTMQVDVDMSYSYDRVLKLKGEPQFYFWQYKSIEKSPTGQLIGSIEDNPEIPYPFDLATWERIYQAGGDFSVLSNKIDTTQPPIEGFDEFVERDRAPVQKIPR